MTGIKSQRQKEYVANSDNSDSLRSYIEVSIVLDEDITRENQHLIEEKVDLFFDEIDKIMISSGHIA